MGANLQGSTSCADRSCPSVGGMTRIALYQHIDRGVLTVKLTIGISLIRAIHQNQSKFDHYRSIQIDNNLVLDIALGIKGCITRYDPQKNCLVVGFKTFLITYKI